MKKTPQHLIIISALGTFFHCAHLTVAVTEQYLSIPRYSWLDIFSSYLVAASVWLFLFKLLRPSLCLLAWCIQILIRGVDAIGELDSRIERWAKRCAHTAFRSLADRFADSAPEGVSEVVPLNQPH
ncbi:hypothetical protein ABC974_09525 [Sphingomonas oligophenolica]|uniref:Uncharacterized protein n=1 Tax=Sphingomonas oligophenolica TaxID=301154 RepID=A0ABU9Y237_9SPHN